MSQERVAFKKGLIKYTKERKTPSGVLGIIFLEESFPQDIVYKFKEVDDYRNYDFFFEDLKKMIEMAFLSGVTEINIINTKKEDFVKNLELLLENKEIDYLVASKIDLKNIKKLSLVIKERQAVLGIASYEELVLNGRVNKTIEETDDNNFVFENIVLTAGSIGFKNHSHSSYFSVILGAMLASSKDGFLKFDHREIPFPVTLKKDAFINYTKGPLKYIVRPEEGMNYYIKEVQTTRGYFSHVIFRKVYLKKYLKSKLESIFLNRRATQEKIVSIETQSKIVLEEFKKRNIIKSFSVKDIFYGEENKTCNIYLEIDLDNKEESICFFIKILI